MATTASLVFAAGRGSRMKGYEGNKALLPLIPENDPFTGTHPILLEILQNLPKGPKGVIVHHRKADVMAATENLRVSFVEQPVLNGTGGALLAARPFLETTDFDHLVVTMGDVPLVRQETYDALIQALSRNDLMVLGFRPDAKKRYGVLETDGKQVTRIIEWEYWHQMPQSRQNSLCICNAGIYALRKEILGQTFSLLAAKPHQVTKTVNGRTCQVEEYFITDLIEPLHQSGRSVGFRVTGTPQEVMGVDTPDALMKAQQIFQRLHASQT